jgi:heat shock protein HslJ
MKAEDSDEYTDYTGCGRYLGNYRLSDIWALTEMDGEAISAADFPNGVPTLDLQLRQGRVFGQAGCNRMNGKFTMGNNALTFGPLASTKMACPAMQFENKYLSALSGNTLTYELDGLKLHLQGREHKLTFKKVD